MDLAETIWREFAVEAEEHLTLIEQVLVHSADAVSAPQVAQLFRSFHSLKGLGRTLGLNGIETAAHLSENILGVVRDGAATLDQPLVECLLRAVDALKDLVAHANQVRGDAAAPDHVIQLLTGTEARLTGRAAPAPQAACAPAPAALDEDPEMLGFFAEALAENLPALARALDPDDEAREAAREAAEMVAHGADLLGFAMLHDNARAIAQCLAEGGGDADRLRRLLDDVRAQAAVVGELAGADPAPVVLPSGGTAPMAELHAGLQRLDHGTDALAAAAREGFHWAGGIGNAALADLFLHVVDLCQRAGRGEVALGGDLRAWFSEVLALAGEGGGDHARAHGLAEALQAILAAKPADVSGAAEAMAQLAIPEEFRALVTAGQAAEIVEAVGPGGMHLYTVLVFLEQNPEIAGGFINWLQQFCRAVTNRSIIEGLDTGFEFLVLSGLGPEEFRQHLLDLDAAGGCIRQADSLTPEGPRALIAAHLRMPEPAAQPTALPQQRAVADQGGHTVIRVRKEAVDDLVRLIGETLLVSNSIGTETRRLAAADMAALRSAVAGNPRLTEVFDRLAESMGALDGLHQRLDMAIQHLHDHALELRVVPLDALFVRLLRAAREMAQAQGKPLTCDAEGRDVRIDKSIVEQLAAPLTHMVRNAVDHGIETADERQAQGKPPNARFFLRAQQRGNEVRIQIGDDGRGLNDQRILATAIKRGLMTPGEADFLPRSEIHRLIFLPGFSTAEAISETSGRGVGMDVVLTTVTSLGGRIDIDSEVGQGTTFTISLPLSAALQTALLVGVGGQVLAVPERHLAEIVKVEPGHLQSVRGQTCVELRGALVPVFRLDALLGMAEAGGKASASSMLVIASGQSRIGVLVDQLHRRQELYMKNLHPHLAAIPGIGGASVLGDGQVVLVLDGDGLIKRARQLAARVEEMA